MKISRPEKRPITASRWLMSVLFWRGSVLH